MKLKSLKNYRKKNSRKQIVSKVWNNVDIVKKSNSIFNDIKIKKL